MTRSACPRSIARRPQVAALCVVLAGLLGVAAAAASAVPAAPAGQTAAAKAKAKPKPKPRPSFAMTANVFTNGRGVTIPRDFVGLSFEAGQLNSRELQPATGNLGGLLKSLAPGIMRFGGDTVENVWYDDGYSTPPTWAASRVDDADLQNLADLVAVSGWKVELGVEAVHNDPVNAADFANAAYGYLGSSLLGIEIGNESDVYIHSYGEYKALSDSYAAAIHAEVPGLPIIGPNTGSPEWLNAAAPSASASAPLTEHLYALSRCGGASPSLAELLSPGTQAQEVAFINNGLIPAQANGVPLRLDETNSVACSGQGGTSDVLAAGLWATDYMLRAAKLGVAGVNFHSGLGRCIAPYYTPLCQAQPGDNQHNLERARALWYAMILVHSLSGTTFLPQHTVSYQDGHNVPVYSTIDRRGVIRVVIDNEDFQRGAIDARVRVKVPKNLRSASVWRLQGPAVSATNYIGLGNAQVAKNGSWKPMTSEHALGDHGDFTVVVRPGTAALLTFSTRALPAPKKKVGTSKVSAKK